MGYQRGIFPKWADFLSQLTVVYSLVTFTLETEPQLRGHPFFHYSEIVVTILFTLEYIARIRLAHNRRGYIFSFFGLVDFFATIPMLLTFGIIDLRFARIIRLLRLLRLLKFIRYSESSGALVRAIIMIRGELTVFAFCIFGIMYVSSVGITILEGETQPEIFGSIARSMWWAVVTVTTVGYGDATPVTVGGKVFTAVILFVGVLVVAIPSGLLASALTRVRRMQEEEKQEDQPPSGSPEDNPGTPGQGGLAG